MTSSLEISCKLPADLAQLLGEPPLAVTESREDYDKLFDAISQAARPGDPIAWLFVRDIVDITWEIRRERGLKIQMIKAAEESAVARILCPPSETDWDPDEEAMEEASQWAHDSKTRLEVDKELAAAGYNAQQILSTALEGRGLQIEAFDRRIASYELRRMAALRECERYSEKLAYSLKEVTSNIVEGELVEAAQ